LRFHTLSGGKESNGVKCRAGWDVVRIGNQGGHGGMFEDVLFGFALFTVTTRRDKDRRVIGHVGHKFLVAEGVRPEARWAIGCKRVMGVGERSEANGKGVERVGFG
jgi:hypothetical protein